MSSVIINAPEDKGELQVLKLMVKLNQRIQFGTPLLQFKSDKEESCVMKAKHVGKITKIFAQINNSVLPG